MMTPCANHCRICTAQDDDSIRGRVLAAGASAWLSKPFSDPALLDAVSAALEVHS